MECVGQHWPISYLGLPMGGEPYILAVWDSVVQRFQEAAIWKIVYLLFGGRITFTLVSIYYMFVFKMPMNVINEIETNYKETSFGTMVRKLDLIL